MELLIPLQGGRRRYADSIQVVALYEAETGRIVHMHIVTTPPGVSQLSDGAAMTLARMHAARVGHPVHRLCSRVTSNPQCAAGRHRIDLATGEFVPL
jgi:hypothetical protein